MAVMAKRPGGFGPAFEVTDLPKPPSPLPFRRLIAILGPSIIALGGTIGSGEWLIGPSLFVKWGLALLWITTVSALLQTFLNTEFARYTIYTGEPVTVGYMRLAPGGWFWGPLYSIVGFIERGLPGWAFAAATALGAFFLGRIPGNDDRSLVLVLGYLTFVLCVVMVLFGRKIERTLEWLNWTMMIVVIGGLFVLDLFLVPANVWVEGLGGFFRFGYIPKGVDILLLGALVGYSAYGGFGNNAMTNWYRDKGYGMGEKVGYISTAVGGTRVKVSPTGKVANATPENINSWRTWMRILHMDQWWIFFLGSMLGMYLPGILYRAMVPLGTDLPRWGVASYIGEKLGAGIWGIYLAAFFGFWILFSTQLSNVDLVARQITDMLWSRVDGVRAWAKEDIRRVYYAVLVVFVIWGALFIGYRFPLFLVAVSANVANFTMALSAILTIVLNRKFLPKEFRPSVWREAVLVANAAFFGFFFVYFLINLPKILGS